MVILNSEISNFIRILVDMLPIEYGGKGLGVATLTGMILLLLIDSISA